MWVGGSCPITLKTIPPFDVYPLSCYQSLCQMFDPGMESINAHLKKGMGGGSFKKLFIILEKIISWLYSLTISLMSDQLDDTQTLNPGQSLIYRSLYTIPSSSLMEFGWNLVDRLQKESCVTELIPGKDNTVRVVRVRTALGDFTQPVVKICPLVNSD